MGYDFGRLNDLAEDIHENSVAHGFWLLANYSERPPRDSEMELMQASQKLMLIVSEVAEAMEELRTNGVRWSNQPGPDVKPLGFGSELADAIIRLLDLAEHYGINIEQEVVNKMRYNRSRPYKHGKAF